MEEQSVIHVKELLSSNQQIWFTFEELITLPKDITTSQIETIKFNEQSIKGKVRRYVVGKKSQITDKTRLIVANRCTLLGSRSSFVGKNTSAFGEYKENATNEDGILDNNSQIAANNSGILSKNNTMTVNNGGMVDKERTIFQQQ